jgi:ubiquinone/menaquinone biosynthesis C-methylase UbiE
MSNTPPAVCDYEGSKYRTDFWEGKGREYEDAVERIALRAMLPKSGARYVEFGAAYGRLIDEAAAYDQVFVVDYSRSLLREAQARLGRSPRYVYVAANIYSLPFTPNTFDVALMCRVIHHFEDAPAALKQIRGTLTDGATFILEHANKLNLKAILRYALRLQSWSPYDRAPIEFVRLNFDFHPQYIRDALKDAGFLTKNRRAVSWLRLGIFKRLLPLKTMVAIDRALQPLGDAMPVSPSLFLENVTPGKHGTVNPLQSVFKCPKCSTRNLEQSPDLLTCPTCGAKWAIHDGIYDFVDAV